MKPISQALNFAPEAPALPEAFSDEVYQISMEVTSPEIAKQIFDKLQPILKAHRADQTLAIACGMLLEKQRLDKGMRVVWDDLQSMFPEDITALRMLMRWYRRERATQSGIDHINALYPGAWHSLEQASRAIIGLAELKAWDEIDRIMRSILMLHSEARDIRMRYIKILSEQSRFKDAAKVAQKVEDRDKMGEASQGLLTTVSRSAETLEKHNHEDAFAVIAQIIDEAYEPRPLERVKRVVFFTGQLGTGGAERQMTRIACAYQKRLTENPDGLEPRVWVKHATAASGADYYMPHLKEAGVPVRVMTEEPETSLRSIPGVSQNLVDLLELLTPDVRRHTVILTSLFREDQTDVAYLWQDGGVVQSAIAAVLAGVPRIVTSFRGLPPNLRPNLFRPELPVLYKALAKLPHVSFTANSQKTATAYEQWLDLPAGFVEVMPNATPPILPDGDDEDHAYWSQVVDASEVCSKTVLGVFRYDPNKRPKDWIEAAARYLKKHDDTRFLILGAGALLPDCAALIEERGLGHRIFLAGIRSNVGFYMHRADLLVHLAEMEGLPNVLIEAQLAGTPVLATPAGGTDEVVAHEKTGIILSSAEVLPEEELDEKLERLLTDEDALARLGSAAMAHSGDRFSVDTILDRTQEIFEKISVGQ